MLVMLFNNLSVFWKKGGNWMAHFEIVSYHKKEQGFKGTYTKFIEMGNFNWNKVHKIFIHRQNI